eukprot:CAMPEP_0171323914 /NCGR_PEP_ID=MMETSP0816-20121228/115871_1 /TAXON_ID=420281 /ORGANISM="Proboscia inermis, Strain CCAP1064/1" /LENGTH=488 /DNA_ID=CAMNT_0011822741 /DNA_START=292 /DNA_END=1758 /DNA_ORIENTATION=+
MSPETEEQKTQVHDWFSFRRTTPASLSIVNAPSEGTFGIWNKKGTEIIEVVSPTNSHPLDRNQARRREIDADKLGSGRFGLVYRGRCEITKDHTPVAIKVTHYIEDAPTHQQSKLALEATILRAMSGNKGFPTVLYDARQSVFGKPSDVLVMQLLGKTILDRCFAKDKGDTLCKDKCFTEAAVMKIGSDVLGCLRQIHEAGFMHNDLKPMNMLFGAQGSGNEDDVHLVDFGMATRFGELQDDSVGGVSLQAGGASPMFASLAQLEKRPTRPVDDVESLWYCLAFLLVNELPWEAGFMHNDLKPMNMLFGAQGSGNEDDVHLVDFGMATRFGSLQDDSVGGCTLQAGGASPMFASLAQLEKRPTRPVDDVESLWYCLAFLLVNELPWQWEPVERLTNIKRRLYIDECGISSDKCTALLSSEDCCSTKHCFETCDKWDVPDAMHDLWWCIVEGQGSDEGVVDYDACLEALQNVYCVVEPSEVLAPFCSVE